MATTAVYESGAEDNYQAYVQATACSARVWIDGATGATQVAVEKVIAQLPAQTWQQRQLWTGQ